MSTSFQVYSVEKFSKSRICRVSTNCQNVFSIWLVTTVLYVVANILKKDLDFHTINFYCEALKIEFAQQLRITPVTSRAHQKFTEHTKVIYY